jgi:hypothetical protein
MYTRLEPELMKRLDDFAKGEQRSRSYVLRAALVEYLDRRGVPGSGTTPPATRAPKMSRKVPPGGKEPTTRSRPRATRGKAATA